MLRTIVDGINAAAAREWPCASPTSRLPYAPQNAHNFMHDKVVVADDTIVSGSFNFSLNATRNAENIVVIEHPALADTFAEYVDGLVRRYSKPTSRRTTSTR